MLTVGVDLAAQPEGTAIAYLEWSTGRASLRGLVVGANDDTIVESVRQADKVGIDCPLGWPVPFVEFVAAHQRGTVSIPPDLPGRDWRRRLAYRLTDLAVREATGQRPLSVAADRIGHTAMRAAGLLARLAAEGHPVDRTGTGVVVEVYPAASLRCWQLPHQGFKGSKNLTTLGELVGRLQKSAPWLDLAGYETDCRSSDHALDAVVAALTARAATQGLVTVPRLDQLDTARSEGWIALPTSPISDLRE
jgi:predicted nuclease with RNAse H fold